MTRLLFTPFSPLVLALTILFLAAFAYLVGVRGKSRATQWFAVFFGGLLLFSLGGFTITALYTTSSSVLQLVILIAELGLLVFFWSFLHFSYWFLGNPFPREARIALWGTSLLLAAIYASFIYRVVFLKTYDAGLSDSLFIFGLTLMADVVLVRKWRHAARTATSDPEHRAARAFRAYALLTGFPLLIATLILLNTMGVLDLVGVLQGLNMIAQFVWFFGIVLVYLNHAPEPISFQTKLVGLVLVTTMAFMAVVSGVAVDEQLSIESIEQEAIRFEPDGRGGFEMVMQPFDAVAGADREVPGGELDLDPGSSIPVALGFAFPFAGHRWDSLYVSPYGFVSFGTPADTRPALSLNLPFYDTRVPKIFPLSFLYDASEGGRVTLHREPGRATLTWHEVPQYQTDRRSTFRLVLHRSGAIDFLYDRIDLDLATMFRYQPPHVVRGLMPGAGSRGDEPDRWTAPGVLALPITLSPGAGYLEDYGLAYQERTHAAVKPLVWLTIAAALFVLIVFPFFFRSSLVRPLERLLAGVRRVDAGDLEAEVPVGVQDEIGTLTQHFNRMTASLRRYSREMEGLVAARTAALERSLAELKATQAQLVQQEKLASLGSLTAGIAHEIKNPLNFINNFAEVNQELAGELREALGAGNTEEARTLLADLEQNASVIAQHGRRADGIVRNMMQHASGGKGRREAVDVNALVSEYIELSYHGKRAVLPAFKVEIVRSLGAVGALELVPQEMGRVLLNLLNNAFDAVHERAQTENGRYVPTVTLSTQRTDGGVEIRVADNGAGIPPEVQDRIFEPFFTTKPAGSGTGLGLSLSFDIVTQGHGGTLTVEGEPGQGTTFVVSLPRQQSAAASHGA